MSEGDSIGYSQAGSSLSINVCRFLGIYVTLMTGRPVLSPEVTLSCGHHSWSALLWTGSKANLRTARNLSEGLDSGV